MISFKFVLSLFIAALVSQCFALPVDQTSEPFTTSSPSTKSMGVRHVGVGEQSTTSLPTAFEEKHLAAPTKQGSKRNAVPDTSVEQSTKKETEAKEPRAMTESFTSETESSSVSTLDFVTRSHADGHIETETPMSITTVTVPFEKRAFPGETTSTFKTESVSTSSSLHAGQSDKHMRHLTDDSEYSSKGSTDDKTYVKSDDYKQSYENGDDAREDRFQDKTNLPKAQYDPSSSIVEAKLPANQMYHDENKVSITEKPFTTMKSSEHVSKREETSGMIKPLMESESTTFQPVGISEKGKSSIEGESTTVRPVDGSEKREVTGVNKPSTESESTTVRPVESVHKRGETSEKSKSSIEGESTTFRPVDGSEKREVIGTDKPLLHGESTTVRPFETSEKGKSSIKGESTTVRPVENVHKREETLEDIKPSMDGDMTSVQSVEGTEKRELSTTDKPLVNGANSLSSIGEKSSTMKPSDKLAKRNEVPRKEVSSIGDKQENTSTLDQGKDTPVSEKKESNH